MAVWKKWVLRPAKVSRKFKPFTNTIKSAGQLSTLVAKNKALRKVINRVFSKFTVKLALGSTAVGVGISYINNYIQSNSGCFLKSHDTVCKVKELSCCQPEAVDNLSFCALNILHPDPCNGYDEDTEKSCCKLCDCKYQNCLPHQTMECRRPTVGEALAHYAGEITSSIWSVLDQIFPWMVWILGVAGSLLVAWIAYKIYRKLRAS